MQPTSVFFRFTGLDMFRATSAAYSNTVQTHAVSAALHADCAMQWTDGKRGPRAAGRGKGGGTNRAHGGGGA